MPPHIAALVEQLEAGNRYRATMYVQRPHWLDYDPVALAVLVIGIGIIELLALIIWTLRSSEIWKLRTLVPKFH